MEHGLKTGEDIEPFSQTIKGRYPDSSQFLGEVPWTIVI